MRFEVPQFIEIEDKIIGPLTWKQFVYLAGGIGIGVVFFITLPLVIFLLFGLPIMVLAGLLAFYPVNNRPFSFFLESMVNYYKGTRLYYWRSQSTVVYRDRSPAENRSLEDTLGRSYPQHHGINNLSRELELRAIQKTK